MSTTAQALQTSSRERVWFAWSTVLLGLVVILYAGVLKALVGQWWSDPDYGHGFLVPLFSGYILWRQRDQMLNCEHELAPDVDKFEMDSPAPVRAGPDGKYPVPEPGRKKKREY